MYNNFLLSLIHRRMCSEEKGDIEIGEEGF